jgi:hypothetical protein
MINNIIVNGSEETTLSTFEITTDGLNLVISQGQFIQENTVLFQSDSTVVPIPVSDESLNYNFYLTTDGLVIAVWGAGETISEVDNLLIQLAWCSVPANTQSLDNIEINVVKVVKPDESDENRV